MVTFPAREIVNGLRICGWTLVDSWGDTVPAYFCSKDCVWGQIKAGEKYTAHPLYLIDADGSEYCDHCFEQLSDI